MRHLQTRPGVCLVVNRSEPPQAVILWTPGHSWDHLCFYMPEEKALFSGDLVLGAGTTVIPTDGDLLDYLRSLRRLLTLELDLIYPAHGPVIRNPREKIEAYLAHRQLRDEQILEGLRDGVRRISALVKRIYTDVPEFLHDAAAMSVLAHLRKLECEGLVEHDGDDPRHGAARAIPFLLHGASRHGQHAPAGPSRHLLSGS